MKKLLLFALTLSISGLVVAQTGTKPKAPAAVKPKTPATSAAQLKSFNDSISYAIGVSVASFYKEQGLTNLNSSVISAAIKDVQTGQKLKMDANACNNAMNIAMSRIQEKQAKDDELKSKANVEAGTAFLEANKNKPGVKTTASGLQYEVLREGTGIKPAATDSVTCHYKGTLLNGTEFDNSYSRGEPITFPLNRVIPGWTEGLQLMSVGSKYKLYIPYTLGYGISENGPIPGGSALIFEVELLDVKKLASQ